MSSAKKRGRKGSDQSEDEYTGDEFEEDDEPRNTKSTSKKRKSTGDDNFNPSSARPHGSSKARPKGVQAGREAPPPELKQEMVRILQQLFHADHMKIFHVPVPRDVPTYYDTIKHPMDFATMRTKLNQNLYPNLNAFKADFDLTFNNAKKFNSKDTIFYSEAARLQRVADTIVASSPFAAAHPSAHPTIARPPSAAASAGGVPGGAPGGTPGAPPRVSGAPNIFRNALVETWNQIAQLDRLQLFAMPVTEEIAPRYFSIVSTPMDLSTIKRKIAAGNYPNAVALQADLNLMFTNALTYNQEGSEVYAEAMRLQSVSNRAVEALFAKLKQVDPALVNGSGAAARAGGAAPARGPQPPGVARPPQAPEDSQEAQQRSALFFEIIDRIKKDDTSGIFHEPVPASVPGYYQTIKYPMDLSTMFNKNRTGQYRSHTELARDFDIMFNNAKTFNSKDTIFHVEAIRLQKLASKYIQDYVARRQQQPGGQQRKLAPPPPMSTPVPSAATPTGQYPARPTAPAMRPPGPGVAQPAGGELPLGGSPPTPMGGPPAVAPKRVIPLSEALMKMIINELMPLDDTLALEVLEDPNALSWTTLKQNLNDGKYRTTSSFQAAFTQLCQNAMASHAEGSPVHTAAKRVFELGLPKIEALANKVTKRKSLGVNGSAPASALSSPTVPLPAGVLGAASQAPPAPAIAQPVPAGLDSEHGGDSTAHSSGGNE